MQQVDLNDAIQAVVRIRGCDSAGCNVGLGSGTIIHPRGVILTARHVAQTDPNNPLSPFRNDFVIELTTDARRSPEARYRARLIAAHPTADLALLRIYQDEQTEERIEPTSGLDLPTLDLADPDKVTLGYTLHILGYPLAGGATINYTEDKLGGFAEDGTLLKIQNALSAGNSGGPALVEQEGEYRIAGIVVSRVAEVSFLLNIHQMQGLTWEPDAYQVWGDNAQVTTQSGADSADVLISLNLHALDFAGRNGRLLAYAFSDRRQPWFVADSPDNGRMRHLVFAEPFTPTHPVERSQRVVLRVPAMSLGNDPSQIRFRLLLWDADTARLLWEGGGWYSVSVEAPEVAQAASPVPTPTDALEPPSATSTFTTTPSSTTSPTATPTPDLTETALAQTVDARVFAALTAAAPTDTSEPVPASPNPTVTLTMVPFATATLEIGCTVNGIFTNLWQDYKEQLGCNISSINQDSITMGKFENGYLAWIKSTNTIYALPLNDTWTEHQTLWKAGDPLYSCPEAEHLALPVMGFGKLWCTNSYIRSVLGNPVSNEEPNSFAQLQRFEDGLIFEVVDGRKFILFEDGTWSASLD